MPKIPDEEARKAAALAEADRLRKETLKSAEVEQTRQAEQGK